MIVEYVVVLVDAVIRRRSGHDSGNRFDGRQRFSVLKAVGQNMQGQCLSASHGFVTGLTVGQDSGQIDYLGNPPPISFPFDFD